MALGMTATRKGPVRRLLERSGRDNLLLAEAVIQLLRAWSAVRFLPFRWAVTSGSAPIGNTPSADPDHLAWAVSAAGAHVPWRAVCFEQGLALQLMLRRRGFDARLHYGIGYSDTGALRAHVWVSLDGRIMLGGEQMPHFKCVAVYPADRSGPSR